MSAKHRLKIENRDGKFIAPGHKELPITMALPFYRKDITTLVHRVRSGRIFIHHEEWSHTAFTFWCGNTGFFDHKRPHATLFAQAPDHAVFCATCEGRAVGAGCDGAREINGRPVLFRPRL